MQSLPDLLSGLPTAAIPAVVVVLIGVAIRFRYGPVLFHPRFTTAWNSARSILVPAFELIRPVAFTIIRARTGVSVSPSISLTNEAIPESAVGVVDLSPVELALAVDTCRDNEVPLLAGFKTDWAGRTESGTFVWYFGPKPFPGAPNWLRLYQVHATTFTIRTDGGDLLELVTAHREANPYWPGNWADHLYKGEMFSAEDGVERMERALEDADVEYDPDHPEINLPA